LSEVWLLNFLRSIYIIYHLPRKHGCSGHGDEIWAMHHGGWDLPYSTCAPVRHPGTLRSWGWSDVRSLGKISQNLPQRMGKKWKKYEEFFWDHLGSEVLERLCQSYSMPLNFPTRSYKLVQYSELVICSSKESMASFPLTSARGELCRVNNLSTLW
jgi:hypothetical protein